MRAHINYLKYVLRHKWFVFLGCLKMDVPLWRAVVHDWTKFTSQEWNPYVRHFFNPNGSKRYVVHGQYNADTQSDKFSCALIHHYRNKHHWQAWLVIEPSGIQAIRMPETYIREMIADWIGAGWAISGRRDPRPWYSKNSSSMVLHLDTRKCLEALLEQAV